MDENPFSDPSVSNAAGSAYTPPSAPAAFDPSTVNFASYEAEQAQIQQQLATQSQQLGLTTQTQSHDQTVIQETNAPWLSASAIASSEPLSLSTTDPMPDGPLMQALDLEGGEMDNVMDPTGGGDVGNVGDGGGGGGGLVGGGSSRPWWSVAPRGPVAPLTGEEREMLKKLVLRMRLANVTAASLMIASAVLTILADSEATMSTLVVGIYVSCFGCLLCCFETHLTVVARTISENFGFMYSAKGRFVFLVLLSTLCFSMDLLGKITGGILCATALLNLFVICKYPQYEEESRAADMRGGGEQSIANMAGGALSGYVKANPDVVANAATGAAKFAAQNPEATASLAGAFHNGNNNNNNYPPPPPPPAGGSVV